MPIETQGGEVFATAAKAAHGISPRIAEKLAHAHRDKVLLAFTAQPGRPPAKNDDGTRRKYPPSVGPSNRTMALHDSMKVKKIRGKKHSAKLVALFYWRYAMEFGSWLRVKSRRIDPPLLVSTASAEVWEDAAEIAKTEIEFWAVNVTGPSTGGR